MRRSSSGDNEGFALSGLAIFFIPIVILWGLSTTTRRASPCLLTVFNYGKSSASIASPRGVLATLRLFPISLLSWRKAGRYLSLLICVTFGHRHGRTEVGAIQTANRYTNHSYGKNPPSLPLLFLLAQARFWAADNFAFVSGVALCPLVLVFPIIRNDLSARISGVHLVPLFLPFMEADILAFVSADLGIPLTEADLSAIDSGLLLIPNEEPAVGFRLYPNFGLADS